MSEDTLFPMKTFFFKCIYMEFWFYIFMHWMFLSTHIFLENFIKKSNHKKFLLVYLPLKSTALLNLIIAIDLENALIFSFLFFFYCSSPKCSRVVYKEPKTLLSKFKDKY